MSFLMTDLVLYVSGPRPSPNHVIYLERLELRSNTRNVKHAHRSRLNYCSIGGGVHYALPFSHGMRFVNILFRKTIVLFVNSVAPHGGGTVN